MTIKEVSEKYPELLHYTTAEGLLGIISTQTLRATHHDYVNDSGEFKYFFDSRLPIILDSSVGKALSELYTKSLEIKKIVDQRGGLSQLTKFLEDEIYKMFKAYNYDYFEAFIISFCGITNVNIENDGLLSQWRAYGADGGYAIVFDTSNLFSSLEGEHAEFDHLAITRGAVEYYNPKSNFGSGSLNSEIEVFKELISKYILEEGKNKDTHADLIIQIIALASLHKHSGYFEENELRIVSILLNSELSTVATKHKKSLEIAFNIRNGLLIPYITLFRDKRLPIKRILVGPHPDRMRRKYSVEKLLYQHGINAEVNISEIPYIGKF